MAYENILFHQKHLVVIDGYFYLLDYTQRLLSQKTSAGSTSFQYPVDIPSTFTSYTVGDVLCLQYDGYNFWTLQKFTDLTGFIIRCWNITNFICTLVRQFPLSNISGVVKYDIKTISIEHYNTFLSQNVVDGSYIININEHVEFAVLPGTTIGLGFNKFNERELVTVSGVVNQDIYLNSPVSRNYFVGDPVTIVASIFVFNDYDNYTANNYGSLIVLNPYTGAQVSKFTDIEYKGVSASKFYRLQGVLQNYPDVFTLAFTKETNLKLRDLRDFYRYRADVVASDYFTGEDYSIPDDSIWEISLGNPNILDNHLHFSTEGSGHDKTVSKYLLLDTFDVQVSGTLSGITTYSGVDLKQYNHYIEFSFQNSKTNISLGHRYSTDYSHNIDNTELLLYFPLNNTFVDYSGNNYIANLTVAPTYVTGVDTTVSGAASFIATTSVNITSNTALEVGANNKDFSLIFWIKFIGGYDSVVHTVLQKSSGGFRSPFIWFKNSANTLTFGVTLVTTGAVSFDVTSTPIDTWFNIAFIKKDSTLYVYYNKVLKGTLLLVNPTTTNASAALYFGTSPQYPGRPFYLDEFKMFSRALTIYEINDFYNNLTGYYTSLNNNSLIGVTINDTLTQYVTTASGVSDASYKFRAIKSNTDLQLSYTTVTSGIEGSWYNFLPINLSTEECTLSLGLHSNLTTVSGAYFDDLVFSLGWVRYPVLTTSYYGTMSMDNVRKNQSTIITIYDIDIDGDNLYRLQGEATYYGTDYTWTTYNYQISPIRSFIDFITVDAVSHILPATGRNTTVVTSITLDQYGQGVVNRPVTFADDDPIGFVTTKKVNTDIFYNTGRANTGYTSGTALRVVTIDASVTQED